MLLLKPIRYAYRELIANRVRQVPFWVLVGFLPTFIVARALVHTDPQLFLYIHHTHVHHFTYGFLILAVAGYVSLVSPRRAQQWLAVFYGIGLALAFDEFGMWVKLTSNYRIGSSEDIMTGILVFLVAVVYGIGIVRRAWPLMRSSLRRQ